MTRRAKPNPTLTAVTGVVATTVAGHHSLVELPNGDVIEAEVLVKALLGKPCEGGTIEKAWADDQGVHVEASMVRSPQRASIMDGLKVGHHYSLGIETYRVEPPFDVFDLRLRPEPAQRRQP